MVGTWAVSFSEAGSHSLEGTQKRSPVTPPPEPEKKSPPIGPPKRDPKPEPIHDPPMPPSPGSDPHDEPLPIGDPPDTSDQPIRMRLRTSGFIGGCPLNYSQNREGFTGKRDPIICDPFQARERRFL
jgi:hypothetical protein